MIDDKKIEEAAEWQLDKLGSYGLNEDEIGRIGSLVLYRKEDVKGSFKAGIDWFLDNLWHPTSEEPKRTNQENEFIECLVRFKDGIVCLYNYDTWHHWWCSDEDNQKFLGLIDKWLYIDDLLPKKGGEQ